MKRLALIGACLLLYLTSFGQTIPKEKMLSYDSTLQTIDTTSYGTSIVCSITNDTLRLAFYKALSYYPELWGKKIHLRSAKIRTSMTASARPFSLFKKRDKRAYKVTVNSRVCAQAQLLHDAPFDAKVGVMGHELAHILDYTTKSGWQVARLGIRYELSKNYRKQLERKTDSTAMSRGLAWQVYHFSHFVMHEAKIDSSYRSYKQRVYMAPEEVYRMAVEMDSVTKNKELRIENKE